MSATESNSTLRFPVRRDAWDTVDFFRSLLSSAIFGTLKIAAAVYLLKDEQMRVFGWLLLTWGIFDFLLRMGLTACVVWDRYAEAYVMTGDALVFEHGYFRHRIPYEELVAVHPMKVCRMTALKPAHRINYRTRFGRRGIDAYPQSDETFLEELAARCPNSSVKGRGCGCVRQVSPRRRSEATGERRDVSLVRRKRGAGRRSAGRRLFRWCPVRGSRSMTRPRRGSGPRRLRRRRRARRSDWR